MITHCISLPNTATIRFQSCGRDIFCCSKEPGDVPLVEIIFSPVSKEGKGHRETVVPRSDWTRREMKMMVNLHSARCTPGSGLSTSHSFTQHGSLECRAVRLSK